MATRPSPALAGSAPTLTEATPPICRPQPQNAAQLLAGTPLFVGLLAVAQAIPLGNPNPSLLLAAALVLLLFTTPSLLRDKAFPRSVVVLPLSVIVVVILGHGLEPRTLSSLFPVRVLAFIGLFCFALRSGRTSATTVMGAFCVGDILYGIGTAAGYPAASLWKYFLAYPATLLALLIARRRRPVLQVTAALCIAVLSVVFDFRSHALVLVGSATIYAIGVRRRGSTTGRTLAFAALAACTAVGIVMIPSIAQSGFFGQSVAASFRRDALISRFPLLAARPQVAISVAAISEKPLTGWGQPPALSEPLLTEATNTAHQLGISVTPATVQIWAPKGRVDSHSVLLGSWVGGGILAFLFGVIALAVLIRALRAHFLGRRLLPSLAICYLLTQLLWEAFFSPLTYGVDGLFALALMQVVASRDKS